MTARSAGGRSPLGGQGTRVLAVEEATWPWCEEAIVGIHAEAQGRLAPHGERRCEQQAGCVDPSGRAPAEDVRRSRRKMCGGAAWKGGNEGGSRIAKCNTKG